MTAISFQARARTVDHLGREQIADCPTAISELWKNAYDAYARSVDLDIYDIHDQPTVAVLRDDGHGMNYDDFVDKWLVIGTESKAGDAKIDSVNRLGLAPRGKLGQKGIGRLSSANLGPLLFVLSKKMKSTGVCSLIDWRIFENPFLNLSDIEIPVIAFKESELFVENLDGMFLTLIGNINPVEDEYNATDAEKERGKRIQEAWRKYDDQAQREGKVPPSKLILNTLNSRPFNKTHWANWPSKVEGDECGTLMLVSEVNFDLEVIADSSLNDMAAEKARARFVETLVNTVDPYGLVGVSGVVAKIPDFDYRVTVTKNLDELTKRVVIPGRKGFDRSDISFAEHQVDGIIDEEGVFTGRIRAFGVWFEGRVIKPPTNLKLNSRTNSQVGKFGIYIAASEQQRGSSTLNDVEYDRFNQLLKANSGLLIFRDGLRVMPYGRTDNDFFDIDSRRSKNAGAAYYANRRMFGRIAISRSNNPNLKDKAGREGFLDNQAAKIFKEIVVNLLVQTAKQYFGRNSKIRQSNLPEIKRKNANAKAEMQRRALVRKLRTELKENLKGHTPKLVKLREKVEFDLDQIEVKSDVDVNRLKGLLESYKLKLSKLILHPEMNLPKGLELSYRDYRSRLSEAEAAIEALDAKFVSAVISLKLKDPKKLLREQARRNTLEHHELLDRAQGRIIKQLDSERVRLADIRSGRRDILTGTNEVIIERFDAGQIDFIRASNEIDDVFHEQFYKSREIYESYQRAVEALKGELDLDYLIRFNMAKSEDLSQEVDKLTGLAQLGIAVEITGHEIQDYRSLIAEAMSRLPDETKASKAFDDIDLAVQGMTEQMKFLSPLRLSGQQIRVPITGSDIHQYLYDFFKIKLGSFKVTLDCSDEFKQFEIQEFRSRIFPVFINLVNNAIYWTSQNKSIDERKIYLTVVKNEVVVSDNGPGVDPIDFEDLFTLFFSRREHTGKGVGLYLARASLAAGGHHIRYVHDVEGMPLAGANFAIRFLGSNLIDG